VSCRANDGDIVSPLKLGPQIIPIGHHQTLSTIPIDEAIPIMSEIGKFKSRLRAMYNDFGAVPVSFEVARLAGKGGHAHIQVVPVPARLKDQVKQAFLTGGQEMNVEWEENPDPTPKGNYFKVELPTGEIMVHKLRGPGFNLQFGRCVAGGCRGIGDWRVACSPSVHLPVGLFSRSSSVSSQGRIGGTAGRLMRNRPQMRQPSAKHSKSTNSVLARNCMIMPQRPLIL
jgi:hypothetical protein